MLALWRSTTFVALRHRNFQHYTWGMIVSLAGTRIHEVASGWFMWELTGSAAWVGALALAEVVPRLLLWPVAGTSLLYPVAAAVLGAVFLVEAHRMWSRAKASDVLGEINPMRLFHASNLYLSLLFVAVALDPLLGR